jgi:hypothetical protein
LLEVDLGFPVLHGWAIDFAPEPGENISGSVLCKQGCYPHVSLVIWKEQ